MECTLVELTQEVSVVVVTNPHEEVTCVAVAVHIVTALWTILLAVETTVCHTHSVSHTLDECPEGAVCAVRADALWLKLVGVCKLVEQYAASLEHHLIIALAAI